MQKGKLCIVRAAGVVLAGLLTVTCKLSAQTRADAAQIEVADLNRHIRDFLEREVTAHVADIKTLNPPPDRIASREERRSGSFRHGRRSPAFHLHNHRTRAEWP
jgi:hypothetical protein